MQANDTHCLHLNDTAKKEHLESWFQEKEIWVSNVKTNAEDWFVGRMEEQSAASKRSTPQSKGSVARLAEESKKMEELQKMETLLKEKQELERRVKMMELELLQERGRSLIKEEIVKSQSRSRLIREMEEEDTDSQNLDNESRVYGSCLDNKECNKEDKSSPACGVGENMAANTALVQNLGEVLLELQKPKLEIKKFDGDCLFFHKFLRQFKSRIEKTCNDDEKMAFLEQFTTGEAHRIVTGYSFLPSNVGYKAAVKELSRRYGDAELMANSYVQKVLQWPLIRGDDPKSIDAFSVFLKECKAATQCISVMNILEHTENLRQILKKLPVFIHDRWRRTVQKLHRNGEKVTFSHLVDFVESEAIKMNDPVWGRNALLSSQPKDLKKPKSNGCSIKY